MLKRILIICFIIAISIGSIGRVLAEESQSQDNTYKINFDDSGSGNTGGETRLEDQDGEMVLIGGFETFDIGYGNQGSNGGSTPADWYNASWLYRKKITFNESQITGASPLIDFPALISITDSNLQSLAQSDGDDILFTNADGITKLNHEIETYTSSTGNLIAWVKVPSLSATANTDIYMYYGNSGASNQQNITGTWNSNYKGVWHLDENVAGVTDEVQDSTSNTNNGTGEGGSKNPTRVTGKIGFSQDFEMYQEQKIYVPDTNNSLDMTSTVQFHFWMNKTDSSDFTYETFISKWGGGNNYNYSISLDGEPDPKHFAHQGGSNYTLFSNAQTSPGNWQHINLIVTGGTMSIYINGVFVESTSATIGAVNNADLYIGAMQTGEEYGGLLDEVRILDSTTSPEWINAEYSNQNSPSTFSTLGSQEPFTPLSGGTPEYNLKTGLQPTFEANVSEVAVLSNVNGSIALYDRLRFQIDPNDNPTSADGVRFAVQISPDNTFSSYRYINPSNFQPDNLTNPNLSTYYQPCAQTASAPADETRWDCGIVGGMIKYIEGLGPNTQYCARIVAMNGDATNSEPGPSVCATTQSLSITFTISPNTSDFGVLSVNNVNTASTNTTLTSYSNAQNGYTVSVTGTGNGVGPESGLYQASQSYLIDSISGNLDANIGLEGYGMQAEVSSGDASLASTWDASLGGRNSSYVGQLLVTPQSLYSRSSPISANDVVSTSYLATIAPSTPSGLYKDTLIFTLSANW